MKTSQKKLQYDKEYAKNNSDKLKEYQKTYYEEKIKNDSEKLKERAEYEKKYTLNNSDKLKEYRKAYHQANKDKRKAYNEANKDKHNARFQERKQTDPLFKLKTNIRQLIRSTIQAKGHKKSTKSEAILGCTFEQFKEHLESQFEPWMTWDNYGNPKDGIFAPNKTWDIDHIIPVTTALTESDIVNLNHYTNLKPLCSYHNRWVKGANI